MNLRQLTYVLGMRPKAKVYAFEVVSFELPREGTIQYAQWLHPKETKKVVAQEVVDELRKFVSPGDVAIDIGAHTGDTTVPMALAVGPQGAVLALEPNPYVFAVLKKNAELNPGKTSIIPLMFAAMPERGEAEFEYSDSGFCNGGLHEDMSKWAHGHVFKLKIRGENLETYMAEHYPSLVPRVRLLKVDAEGYDYQVLASLRNLIAAQRPYIKAEVYKLLNLSQRERLFDLLTGLGYRVHLMESDTNLLGTELTRQDLMLRRHYDVFCVPRPVTSRDTSSAARAPAPSDRRRDP